MRWVAASIVLACLVLASSAAAGDGEQLTASQLPPEVVSRIRERFRAEPLHARKEVEGDKSCYVVTAAHAGQVIEIYASPQGNALLRKTESFSLARWPEWLAVCALFLLLPGVVVGAAAQSVARAVRDQPLSVPGGWLSAWAGAGVGMALVVFNLATVPREKDVPVLGAYCVLWGAIAASMIEGVGRAMQSRQPARSRRRWVIGCGVVVAACLALSIPFDILRIERENRHLELLALRPPAD
jgi:hypothetical protein